MENYAINKLGMNEQNSQAKGFYEHMGFQVYKELTQTSKGILIRFIYEIGLTNFNLSVGL